MAEPWRFVIMSDSEVAREPPETPRETPRETPSEPPRETPLETGDAPGDVPGDVPGDAPGDAEQRISSLPARAEDAAVRIKESHDNKRKRSEESAAAPAVPETVPARVEADNAGVLESVADLPERQLGTVVYEPRKLLLKEYDDYWNSIVQVRLARRYVSQNHEPVRRRAVWGTSIYTDDSDLVAALYHEGYFAADSTLDPNADLLVSLRVLPPLRRYVGSTRNGINSRTWLSPHDGTSFLVTAVAEIAQGSAEAPLKSRRQRARLWGEVYRQARPASRQPTASPAEV